MFGASSSVSSRRHASWPARNASNVARSRANSGPSRVGEREVDVARVALALVELRHEADRHALLGGDLLGAVLVDRVVVGGAQRVRVAEVDLVLAEVALALGVLDRQPGAGHRVADPADQRLDPRGAEQRVVDVVEVGRLEVAVALAPRLLVAVAEHEELELGARRWRVQPRSASRASWRAQDLARRGDDVASRRPRRGRRGTAPSPSCHGTEPQRREVGAHREVAVARAPTTTSRSRRPVFISTSTASR